MLRKFAEGLVFGAGFTIAFVLIGMVATPVMFPVEPPGYMGESMTFETPRENHGRNESEETPFHELPIDEQIKVASVIALAKYEPAEDGRMKAVLKELLKEDERTVIHYEIGDEYPQSSYYPSEGTNHGDGLVIFFAGSPAMMRMAMSYSGDRIRGLGDMPLELFRSKCDGDVDGGT